MLAVGLVVIGILARIMMHSANFTPVLAIALFGGVYLNRRAALWLPVALMAVTDTVLGWHPLIPFTWGSMVLVALLGMSQRGRMRPSGVALSSVAAAVLFFVITNFGAWLLMYPRDLAGFVSCYLAAVPFFRQTLLSTVMYTAVLFVSYEWMARRVQSTRLAWVVEG